MKLYRRLAFKYASDPILPPPMDEIEEEIAFPKPSSTEELHSILNREEALKKFNDAENLEVSLKEIALLRQMLTKKEVELKEKFLTPIPP